MKIEIKEVDGGFHILHDKPYDEYQFIEGSFGGFYTTKFIPHEMVLFKLDQVRACVSSLLNHFEEKKVEVKP